MSEWTIESLKEHIDQRFDDNDKALRAALIANEKRLDGMNEFREELTRQAASFVTKPEHQLVLDSISSLDRRITGIEGRGRGSEITKANVIAYFGIATAIITVIVIWASHR